MMAPGHSLTGAAAGLGAAMLANSCGIPISPTGAFLAAAICAGAALLPDIDHPGATVSRAFGPASMALSHGLHGLSARVYDGTRLEMDEDRDGGHRGVTHTWPFALLVGSLVALLILIWGRWAVLGTLFVFLSLAIRGLLPDLVRDAELAPGARRRSRLRGWIGISVLSAGLTWLTATWLPGEDVGTWLGAIAGLGCLVHCWGDSLTLMGCPWLWPIPIAGQRWYPIGMPEFLRFRAGGTVERVVVALLVIPSLLALCVATFPQGWSTVVALIGLVT